MMPFYSGPRHDVTTRRLTMPDVRIGDWVNGWCSATVGDESVDWPFPGTVFAIEGDDVWVEGDDGEEREFSIDAIEVLTERRKAAP